MLRLVHAPLKLLYRVVFPNFYIRSDNDLAHVDFLNDLAVLSAPEISRLRYNEQKRLT
jgi:hypothetical protein